MRQDLEVAVVLASAGRPELLAEALRSVAGQVGVAFTTVVSVPDETSLPVDRSLLDGVRVVTGTKGLAAQRNTGIEALDPTTQVVAFFDDDAVLRADWLVMAVDFLQQHDEVIGLTGRVLIDGAVSGEVSHERTAKALVESEGEPLRGTWTRTEELYGCNFALRLDRVGEERFDERLPLYSWLEDHDMARRLLRRGALADVDDCVIVHRAAASGGRQNHLRLGYSQVMNPAYLRRKGSFGSLRALDHLGRRAAKNAVLSLGGPQRDWRRERLRGNALAAYDVARGRFTPERIVELPNVDATEPAAPTPPRPTSAIEVVPSHWSPLVVRRWLRQNLVESTYRHLMAVTKRREWEAVTIRPSLADATIVLTMCIKDERARLDYHLDYYRLLGVDHFLIVDNDSSDGTLEHLEEFDDVSTFRAGGSFLRSRFATDWINGILHRYCVGKWVMWIDADELLVFSANGGATIPDVVERLEHVGRRSLQTIMLDMYSDRPPSRNALAVGQDPLEVCDRFDRSGYRQAFSHDNRTSWIKGGVRSRLFFDDPMDGPALNKTPLVKWRRHQVFMKVGHQLWPGGLNGTLRIGGALLHFKFTDVAASKISDDAYRAEHTEEYDAYDELDSVTFVGAETERYSGPAQLARLGLIEPFV